LGKWGRWGELGRWEGWGRESGIGGKSEGRRGRIVSADYADFKKNYHIILELIAFRTIIGLASGDLCKYEPLF